MEEVNNNINTAKDRLLKIIEEIPENEVIKILDFGGVSKRKKRKKLV